MITIVTIGGADKSGALARITAFLSRKGYALQGHQIEPSASGQLLKMKLKASAINKDELAAEIKALHEDYTVLGVEFEGKDGVRAQSPSVLIREIAAQYPDIVPLVHAYAASFNAQARPQALLEAGRKIGAFVYSKEWSFGSPLKMPAALHRTLVPALEKWGKVEATDTGVALADSPFCQSGSYGSCCEFVTGFMQGFLDAGPSTKDIQVLKTKCSADGAARCTYTVKTAEK
ncbi:MAG TPA: hypothetical protein VFZ81_03410 [Burkholderiales bacterium]